MGDCRFSTLLVSFVLFSAAAGCERKPDVTADARLADGVGQPVKSKAPSEAAAMDESLLGPAKLPFDFPVVTVDAKPGSYVLAPSQGWIEEAALHGAEKQSFVYYGGWLVKAGPEKSLIRTLTNQHSVIPNVFIIAIPSDQTAEPGDVVLTSWASGSGMQRAIVVDGGSPQSPAVRYLDMTLDNPSGWAQKTDRLPPNTFVRLTEPGDVGSTVACRDGKRLVRYVVMRKAGDKLLGVGFAGAAAVLDAADCERLPIKLALKPKDSISIPLLGNYIPAIVARVENDVGRVLAAYQVGNEMKEESFGIANVAPLLTPPK